MINKTQTTAPAHLTKAAKTVLTRAVAQRNHRLQAQLRSPRAALPSIEELEAQLGGDFLQQQRNVVIVQDANDRPA